MPGEAQLAHVPMKIGIDFPNISVNDESLIKLLGSVALIEKQEAQNPRNLRSQNAANLGAWWFCCV
ncbi:MAG: hypothetical protein RI981_321 [Bacteroidota bacterium]